MISTKEEEYILGKAYVPEHIPRLMVGISGAEPFLIDDFLSFSKDDWLLFIGYPLEGSFSEASFAQAMKKARKRFSPSSIWLIASAVPQAFLQDARGRETDEYYKLDLRTYSVPKGLKQILQKASHNLTVEKTRSMLPEHMALTRGFLEKENLNSRVRELYLRMPSYLSHSESSLLLNAWDEHKNLSAFYVLERGAAKFFTYVVGCFSRKYYVPHASDLLFYEMVNLAVENQKEYIHLGLGVNEGIRRFKKKWGGVPFLKYEAWELSTGPKGPFSWVQALQGKI